MPGPGEYDVKNSYQVVVTKQITSSIGTSKRKGFGTYNKNPGPGNYTLPSCFDKYKKPRQKKVIYNGIYITQKRFNQIRRDEELKKEQELKEPKKTLKQKSSKE